MKYLFFIITVLLIDSCKPIQASQSTPIDKSSLSKCPEDGICTFEVLKNSNLIVKTDEFGNQYKEVLNGPNIVLKFEYKRNEIPNTADSAYKEEIYIELNPNEIEIELANAELKKANVVFSRFCFCRGQTGSYRIDSGTLSVIKLANDSYRVNLEFKCGTVPQVIESLSETFKL